MIELSFTAIGLDMDAEVEITLHKDGSCSVLPNTLWCDGQDVTSLLYSSVADEIFDAISVASCGLSHGMAADYCNANIRRI